MKQHRFTRRASIQILETRRMFASIAFKEHELFAPDLSYGYSARAFDLDADGRMDLVASTRGKIVWFQSTENGFGDAQTLANHSSPAGRIEFGDVDSDGDVDILLLSDEVGWFENPGDHVGGFQEHIIDLRIDDDAFCIPPISRCTISAVDLDQDGDIDLFAGNQWWENTDGGSNFQPNEKFDIEFDSSIGAIDMDQDSDIDLIASEAEGIVIYSNSGRNENRFERNVVVENVAGQGRLRAILDDADGDHDIDITIMDKNQILIYENSSGRFETSPRTIAIDAILLSNLSFVDFDGDQDKDMVVNINGTGFFMENVGENEYLGPVELGPMLFRTKMADLDADGDLDFYNKSNFFNLAWQENQGNGTFGETRFVASGHPIESITSTDFDNDGLHDLLAWGEGHLGPSGISVFKRLPDGSYARPEVVSREFFSIAPLVADVDGDGSDEIITQYRSDELRWYRNDGTGGFQEPKPILDFATQRMVAADVDQDGDSDLLVSGLALDVCRSDCGLSLLRNDDTNFKEIPIADVAPAAALFSDVDGDQDADILTIGANGIVEWFENIDSGGSFVRTDHSVDTSFDNLWVHGARLLAEDKDGDGDQDVIVTDGNGCGIWLENTDGSGTFRIWGNSFDGPSDSMAFADLDQDGDIDLVGISYDWMFWLENTDGKGNFYDGQNVSEEDYANHSVNVADVDLDGDLDLIVGRDDGRILWFESRSVGDVNGDGVFDSSDLVRVFQAGFYDRDDDFDRAGFDEGDWNGDGFFDSADLVIAFQSGQYDAGAE